MSDSENFEPISSEDFKKKYKRDVWSVYEVECKLLKSYNLKVKYWSKKKNEYLQDKIRLSFASITLLDPELKEPKQLTGYSFDTFCEKKIELIKIYNTDKKEYVSENEKKAIDEKYFPNGFPYLVKSFKPESYSNSKKLEEPFESLKEYEQTVKNIRHSNALRFFHFIKKMNETDFIKEINNQYLNYTLENIENAEYWLNLTYDLVLKGFSIAGKIEDINIRGAFINWYNEKLKELNKIEVEVEKPQPKETKKPDKPIKELHNQYFKDNAFEVWQCMFDKFEITERSYNKDLDFMYAVMHKKGFIHKQIGKTDMLDWIRETYQMTFSKIQYTNYQDSSNKKRMSVYNMINFK